MSSKSVIRSQQQHKVFIASVSYTAIAPLSPLVPDRLLSAGNAPLCLGTSLSLSYLIAIRPRLSFNMESHLDEAGAQGLI